MESNFNAGLSLLVNTGISKLAGVQGAFGKSIEGLGGSLRTCFFYTNWSSIPGSHPKIEIGVGGFNAVVTVTKTTHIGYSERADSFRFSRRMRQPDCDPPTPVQQ